MIDGEWRRVLKPVGSLWLNLGDKYAGSGGHNNATLGPHGMHKERGDLDNPNSAASGRAATRRNAPDTYQKTDMARPKSLLGLPWRVALALIGAGWILRAEVIWSKPNGLPESVTDRVRRSHEQWFHFVLSPQYFSAVDEIREPHAAKTLTHRGGGESWGNERNPDNNWSNPKVRRPDPLGRLPGSVWTIPTDPLLIPDAVREQLNLVDHFAAFPQEWPRRIIKAFAPEGGCVLDPFGGTGTTAGVARMLGRKGISVDLSADYCRLAEWRIFESGHFSKTEQRSWADKQTTLC